MAVFTRKDESFVLDDYSTGLGKYETHQMEQFNAAAYETHQTDLFSRPCVNSLGII